MESPQVKWECLDCKSLHPTEAKADSCCYIDYDADSEDGFRCSLCDAYYDKVDDARDCCDHSAKVFICPICTTIYPTEWAALTCCPRDNDPLWQMRCDLAVLESHGQL